MRDLPTIANATPTDYLSHAPTNPDQLGLQMIEKCARLYPYIERDDGVMRDPSYTLLYVGPGAGLVVQTIIDQGHRAYGIETSRRGIVSGPETSRSYVKWALPWENPFSSKRGDPPTPYQMFHLAIINKFLKQLLTPEEWKATTSEIKKISKNVYGI